MKLRTAWASLFVLAIIAFPGIGHAQEAGVTTQGTVFADSPTPEKIGPVGIVLDDIATDGCWTNLGETKRYATDKLIQAGYEVEDDPKNYQFIISVQAQRMRNGSCVGYAEVYLAIFNVLKGNPGLHSIGSSSSLFVEPDNGNVETLNLIRHVVGEI